MAQIHFHGPASCREPETCHGSVYFSAIASNLLCRYPMQIGVYRIPGTNRVGRSAGMIITQIEYNIWHTVVLYSPREWPSCLRHAGGTGRNVPPPTVRTEFGTSIRSTYTNNNTTIMTSSDELVYIGTYTRRRQDPEVNTYSFNANRKSSAP